MKKIIKIATVALMSLACLSSVKDVDAAEGDPFSINGVEYSTFESALTAVPDNGEIVLSRDYSTSETIKINTNKTFSLNMNGYSIVCPSVSGVINVLKGNVNIYDNVGTSVIQSTAFDTGFAKTVYVYKKYSSADSILTISNVSILSNYYGVYLGKSGVATLNNVNINSTYNFVIGNNSKLYINGGIYYASEYNLFGVDVTTVDNNEISLTSGSFASQLGTVSFSNVLYNKVEKFISGGTFDHDITEFVQDEYTVINENNNYVVIDPNSIVDTDSSTNNDNTLDDIDLDALINEYEDRLNGLDDRENALNDREEELNNRENELDNRENTLDDREDGLDNRDNALDNRESDLDNLENNLNDREDSLNDMENNLNDREDSLDDRENGLNDREFTLDDRENELDNRENTLDNREEELNNKENELNDREQELIVRERQLQEQSNVNNVSPINYVIINNYIDNSSNSTANDTNKDNDTNSRNVSFRVDYNYLDNVEVDYFDEIKDDYNIDYLINVDCFLYDNDKATVINKLTQLNRKIRVKVQLPEGYTPDSYIYVAKYHNNKVELIKATVTEDNMLSFETSQFSLFAIVSHKNNKTIPLDFVPSTADSVARINRISNINNVWLLIISIILIPIYVVMRKKAK